MAAQPPTEAPPAGAVSQQVASRAWSTGFFDCFSPFETCMAGWCCPCFLYGKASARLSDPSLRGYSPVNIDCILWACIPWVVQTMKRVEIRERYGIEGSAVTDCVGAFCCGCCSLVQMSKEVKMRTSGSAEGTYQTPQGMKYGQ
ncbi:PLAC8 family domain containing protein [Elaphomyces granulatus]